MPPGNASLPDDHLPGRAGLGIDLLHAVVRHVRDVHPSWASIARLSSGLSSVAFLLRAGAALTFDNSPGAVSTT